MKIDLNKTYQTKAGHDVRIFTTGAPEPYPVVGIWHCHTGQWIANSWSLDGCSFDDYQRGHLSLVEVKPRRLVYVNLYEYRDGDRTFTTHGTAPDAHRCALSTATAVAVPVYIEEEE